MNHIKNESKINREIRTFESGEIKAGVAHLVNLCGDVVGDHVSDNEPILARKMSSEGEVENPVEKQRRKLDSKLKILSIQANDHQYHHVKSHKSTKKSSPSKSLSLNVTMKAPIIQDKSNTSTSMSKPSVNTIKINPFREFFKKF